jgi:hypothetical protein
MMNWLRATCIIAVALTGCSPTTDGDDDGGGGETAEGGAMAGGGALGAGGQMDLGGNSGAGGMEISGFMDPDEGEPQPYVLPADLEEQVDGGDVEACPPQHAFINSARGWAVDRIGRPLDQAMVQLCVKYMDTAECLTPTSTNADGVFRLNTIEGKRCLSKMVFRSIMPGGLRAPAYVDYDVTLAANVNGDVVLREPFVLYATTPIPNPPEVESDEDEYTFVFHTGMEIDLIPFDLNSDYLRLGIRVVDTSERGLTFLEGHPAPDLLFAMSPDSSVYGDGAPIRIPNTLGLAAGAKVDLFFTAGVGCKDDGELVDEGEWINYGTGTVSADGAMIASDSDSGLTCVSWLGVSAQ